MLEIERDSLARTFGKEREIEGDLERREETFFYKFSSISLRGTRVARKQVTAGIINLGDSHL